MKKLALFAFVGLIAGTTVAQTRTEEYLAASVKVEEMTLIPLSDGGCMARWYGFVTSRDGGSTIRGVTPDTDLKLPVMQSRCDALKTAGEGRLGVALRLQLDGGAP